MGSYAPPNSGIVDDAFDGSEASETSVLSQRRGEFEIRMQG
jgi:hypothetical protein